jgi:hypothetical protein
MQTTLRIPTVGLVQSAISEFDDQNDVIEAALTEHFHQYPTNTNLPHVLLKVVVLNRLYSTQILAVLDVARNIQSHGEEIDIGLAAGSAEVVEKIGLVTIQSTGKERYNYSFATKYCSWHRPDSYPMWDSRVDHYLWALQQQEHFAPSFGAHKDIWIYEGFRDVVAALRTHYGLSEFTYKDLDKFLWSEAGISSSEDAVT